LTAGRSPVAPLDEKGMAKLMINKDLKLVAKLHHLHHIIKWGSDWSAKKAEKDRVAVPALLLTTVARPILSRAAKSATEWLFRTDEEGFQARLAQVRDRTRRRAADEAVDPDPTAGTGDEEAGSAGA